MPEQDAVVLVDKITGLVGRAMELPQGGWKLVPMDPQNPGHLAFLRKDDDIREVSADDQLYEVDVAFSNEDEDYGGMTLEIVADNDEDAEVRALAIAGESVFDDERIPDRHVAVSYEQNDDLRDEIVGGYDNAASTAP